MMKKSDSSERSPLLPSTCSSTVRFYAEDDVVSEPECDQSDAGAGGARRCRGWMSGGEAGGDSDAEYLSSASRSSRTLPNNAPAPFVYLGLCCAVLAGLCFTSRSIN